jgi:uncharacterized membrane protein YphA (DoxX/SURF4 family)
MGLGRIGLCRRNKLGHLNMRILGFGHALFGLAVAGLAVLGLVYGDFTPILEPFPALLPWPEAWTCLSAAILLAASACLIFPPAATVSAMIIGVFASVWVMTRARSVFLTPLSVGSWYGVCEALGPLVGAWVLYILLHRRSVARSANAMTSDRALHIARLLFGAACVVYGAAHFAYGAYTAAMVPKGLPDRMGFAYFTGACHAAAGFGLLFGVFPRLAATMEAIMLTLFGVLVWLPSFFAQPRPGWASPIQNQWSETFLTFLLAASAWIVASSLASTPWGIARTAPRDLK